MFKADGVLYQYLPVIPVCQSGSRCPWHGWLFHQDSPGFC
jgi:hypothetical protein